MGFQMCSTESTLELYFLKQQLTKGQNLYTYGLLSGMEMFGDLINAETVVRWLTRTFIISEFKGFGGVVTEQQQK